MNKQGVVVAGPFLTSSLATALRYPTHTKSVDFCPRSIREWEVAIEDGVDYALGLVDKKGLLDRAKTRTKAKVEAKVAKKKAEMKAKARAKAAEAEKRAKVNAKEAAVAAYMSIPPEQRSDLTPGMFLNLADRIYEIQSSNNHRLRLSDRGRSPTISPRPMETREEQIIRLRDELAVLEANINIDLSETNAVATRKRKATSTVPNDKAKSPHKKIRTNDEEYDDGAEKEPKGLSLTTIRKWWCVRGKHGDVPTPILRSEPIEGLRPMLHRATNDELRTHYGASGNSKVNIIEWIMAKVF